MANKKNLKPFTSDQSRDEAVKNGKHGGIVSGEVRRERRKLRDDLNYLLDQPFPDKKAGATLGVKGMDVRQAVCMKLIAAALHGDIKAFEILRDTIGEKPRDELTVSKIEPDFTALNEAFEALALPQQDD